MCKIFNVRMCNDIEMVDSTMNMKTIFAKACLRHSFLVPVDLSQSQYFNICQSNN